MKKSAFLILCLLLVYVSKAQNEVDLLFSKMKDTYDQFDKTFKPKPDADPITIIYIPGNNDPFGKIYDKHKGKKIIGNVQFIGGFKEIMRGAAEKPKRKHLQQAFQTRYGKNHFTILLDLESELAQIMSVEGYAIFQISSKENKLLSRNDFGFDRLAFFKALGKYLQ